MKLIKMDNEILFTESQGFKQWWLWIMLITVNVFFLFIIYKQIILGQQFGDNPVSNTGLITGTGLFALFTILFWNFKLQTQIRKDGIYIRFLPFQFAFKQYSWANISASFVREYKPIQEYGGWGFRLGLFGRGRAYNVSGNKGLQLVFEDNNKLLIGTNKPAEMEKILIQIGQLKQ